MPLVGPRMTPRRSTHHPDDAATPPAIMSHESRTLAEASHRDGDQDDPAATKSRLLQTSAIIVPRSIQS
jgi:hypothetical protein